MTESERNIEILCSPLRGRNTFSGIFRKSKKISADKLYVLAVLDFKTKSDDDGDIRTISFSVNVRKKIVRHAVCRNRIRRLVRVAIREAAKEDRYKDLFCHIRFLPVFWISPIDKPSLLRLPEVKANIATILQKLNEFYIHKQTVSMSRNRCQ